jgi:hypothetical protein
LRPLAGRARLGERASAKTAVHRVGELAGSVEEAPERGEALDGDRDRQHREGDDEVHRHAPGFDDVPEG